MKKIISILLTILFFQGVYAQIPLPDNLPQRHPRLMPMAQHEIDVQQLHNRIDPYLENTQSQPDWLLSRLMMYWKSKATNIYINGGVYSHADGEAPVPTVRFGSTRGVGSSIFRPKIEDIIPYMDDTKGVYFHNQAKEGKPLEWVDQANVAGGQIESVNEEIIRIGKDAGILYQLTGNEKYALFAYDLFHTYMSGMYYRNEPVDLGNGHAQTLVGMSTFEVIQERILRDLAYLYDFIFSYIEKNHSENIDMYAATFKKWMDITIKNGVPQNNWNLHQAKFILKVAMVLEDDNLYADKKGREYYIDYILNRTSPRQWSLTKFMDYGYDPQTGIWNECPGYAIGVTKDLTNFVRDYDNTFRQNLLPYLPVLKKAVEVLPQYLFPNKQTSAFGDSYYGELNTEPISDMIQIACKYYNKEDEVYFTRMYNTLAGKSTEAGKLTDYATQTFYAPNVSWFVQRSNYDDPFGGLMISQYASYGNHAHSNGVAMELYGKGCVLGAESGIGSTYFEKPYLEYYSQFPAHNTVMVDGISKYPEMLSNHPFDLLGCYPKPEQKADFYPGITYSEIYFLEPESRSDQNRLLSIVRTSETTGYYVDIFRSKKQREGDKFHDYFYHNLGQELFIKDAQGSELKLQPSDEMAFAGGHLFALDYMWDKQSARTNEDYQAVWKMSMPNDNHVYMNLWMKGYPGREIFSIKAPSCKAFRSNDDFPYEVNKAPYLTIAARQHGEAWNQPFVSVFEPTIEKEGRSIQSIESFMPENASSDFVGVKVNGTNGRTDYIFSSVRNENILYNHFAVNATYSVISEQAGDFVLFVGNGQSITAKGITMKAVQKTNMVLEYKNGQYYISCGQPVSIEKEGKKNPIRVDATDYRKIQL